MNEKTTIPTGIEAVTDAIDATVAKSNKIIEAQSHLVNEARGKTKLEDDMRDVRHRTRFAIQNATLDSNGKPAFSNDVARQHELDRRLEADENYQSAKRLLDTQTQIVALAEISVEANKREFDILLEVVRLGVRTIADDGQ